MVGEVYVWSSSWFLRADEGEMVDRWAYLTHRCGGGGGVRRGPDPEERCTRTPDSVSGYTPVRRKTKGAGGLYPKSVEAFIKICNRVG
jgi:hypothetical protein